MVMMGGKKTTNFQNFYKKKKNGELKKERADPEEVGRKQENAIEREREGKRRVKEREKEREKPEKGKKVLKKDAGEEREQKGEDK